MSRCNWIPFASDAKERTWCSSKILLQGTGESLHLVLEIHSDILSEMRRPSLLSQYQRHPLVPTSSLLNVHHYWANFLNSCAFHHSRLLHLKARYVEWLPCSFSLICITHIHLRIESTKLDWVSEKHSCYRFVHCGKLNKPP